MNKKIAHIPYLVFITVCSTSPLSAAVSFYMVWWSAGIQKAAYCIQDVHDIHYRNSLPNMGNVVYTRSKIHVWKSNEKTFHQVYCTQRFLLCFSMWVSSRVGPKSQWFEWLVIRVTWKSSFSMIWWLESSLWLDLHYVAGWLDLLGLQWLVCDLRVLKSHMRTRYSRNGSCNLQNCSNFPYKHFVIRNFIGQNLLIRRKTPN